MPKSPPRCVGIIRVSQRNRREGSGHSPEVQRRLITGYAESQGWDLLDVLDENDIADRNVSGGADLSKRPGFGPAVERLGAGQADVIVAAEMSRLFRDLDVQRSVIAQIEAAGGELWTVSDGRISHETADSEFSANIKGSMNAYQRRYAADKSWLAVEIAIEEGKVPWHQTPPGYLRSSDSKLSPDPALQDVVAQAFRLRADGATIKAVRSYLSEHGIKRSHHGVQHLLRDRLYVGEIHFPGDTDKPHTPNLAAHLPIVDRHVFDAVQALKVNRGPRPQSTDLLARLGVLVCATCGSRMSVGTANRSGYRVYKCNPTSDCPQRAAVSAEKVEAAVIDRVRSEIATMTGTASSDDAYRDAQSAAEAADGLLQATLTAFLASGTASESGAVERLTALREDRDSKRQRAKQLRPTSTPVVINGDADWDTMSLETRRDLIRAVIDRIAVKPGRLPTTADDDSKVIITVSSRV